MNTLLQPGEFEAGIATDFARRRVFLVCLKFVRDPDLADDMTSEVFLRAWRARGRFRATCKLSTWLHRIAVNVCLEYVRREKSRPNALSLDDLCADKDSPAYMNAVSCRDRTLDGCADRHAALTAIDELPVVLQKAVLMSDLEGYTIKEIAVELRVGINAVKSRIHRGRHELRETLRQRR